MKDNLIYYIIVANENNKRGVMKLVNSYTLLIQKADKLILAFPDEIELENIKYYIHFKIKKRRGDKKSCPSKNKLSTLYKKLYLRQQKRYKIIVLKVVKFNFRRILLW